MRHGKTPAGPYCLLALAVLAVGVVTGLESRAWRGAAFPGFFLLPNRVIASISLPGWAASGNGRPLYQAVLTRVDDTPVDSTPAAAAAMAAHAPAAPVRLSVRRLAGDETLDVPVRRFTETEWWLIFGAYLVCGAAFLGVGTMAATRGTGAWAGGVASFCLVVALFLFTALDLYGAGRFFRLHALAECFLAAVATHLMLVCPTVHPAARVGRRFAYGMAAALAVVYQGLLFDPIGYVLVHNLAQALGLVPVIALVYRLMEALDAPPVELGMRGVYWMVAGTLPGVLVPGILLGLSGLTGGQLQVNPGVWFGVLFPLGVSVAVRRRAAAVTVEGAKLPALA